MSRGFALLFLAACGSEPVTETDLAEAQGRASSWFAAVQRQDCDTLVRLSQTSMRVEDCRAQAAILHDRYLSVSDIEGIRPSIEVPGAIEADARVVDSEDGERVLTLTLVRSSSGWVVRI